MKAMQFVAQLVFCLLFIAAGIMLLDFAINDAAYDLLKEFVR